MVVPALASSQPPHLIVGLDRYLPLDRLSLGDGNRLSKVKHRLLPVCVLREGPRRELQRFVQLRERETRG